MSSHEITVITASFNSINTIKATIESILNQTFTNFEYIIIDGNSTDGTLDIIKKFEPIFKEMNIDFKWQSEVDKGIYDAWNKGIKLSSGKWISFLGSDDEYVENAIEIYSTRLVKLDNKKIDLVYSNVNYVCGKKFLNTINGVWSWNIFKRYMNIAHVGSFHSKNLFEKYGIFDERYKICGDYELLLRAQDNLKTSKIEKTTVIMQSGGVSNKHIKKAFQETYKAKCNSGNINPIIAKGDYYLAFLKFSLRSITNNFKRF